MCLDDSLFDPFLVAFVRIVYVSSFFDSGIGA